VTLCSVLLYARRYERTIEAAQTVLDLDVNFAPAHYFLSQALTQLGRDAQALEHAERAVTYSNSSSETLALLGHALARSGQRARAEDMALTLDQRAGEGYVSPTHRAQVQLGMGDHARALALLEEACEARASDLVWLGVRPLYDPLRSEPRFLALLERMHLV
jgi:tetratricopeptide (TPR) repeat protein